MGEKGLVQIYWGDGKGKTTAALGQLFRYAGHDMSCTIIQFLKSGIQNNPDFDEYGECKAAQSFQNITWKRFGLKKWYLNRDVEAHKTEIQKGLDAAIHTMEKKPDLLILDEILYAVQMNLLSEEEVCTLIRQKPGHTELILTGSHRPLPKIFEHADLVTEVKKHKHPFDEGIPARKGPEF